MSSTMQFILAIAAGISITYFFSIFRFIKKPYRGVVETNLRGETKIKVWDSGIHLLLIPISPFMRVVNRLYCADLTTLVTIGNDDNNPGKPSLVEFSDTSAGVTIQLITKIIDPIKATYEIDNYLTASINLAEAYLRRIFADFSLDLAMKGAARDEVAQAVFLEIKETLSDWGVEIKNVAIMEFDLSKSTLEQREKILEADKEKIVTITKAEGEAKAIRIKAAAEAIAKKTLAAGEGKAEWIKIQSIANKLGLDSTQVIAWLLNQQLLSAMEASTMILSTSKEGTLNLPHIDMAATMAAIQQTINKKD